MQTKTSYRVLKWALLMGTAASFATACVVTTSGDGTGNLGGVGDTTSGGDSTSTSGKTSTGGTESTAGTTSTGGGGSGSGGTSGSTSTAGTSMTEAGAGGAYVPGQCQTEDPTPTSLPSCDPNPERDKDQPCKVCMKAKCCTEWQTCYGDSPTSACGWGATADANGQFDCIIDCYAKNEAGETDPSSLLESCASSCTNQCDAADNGNILDATNALISCANADGDAGCQTECFPFN